MKKLEFSIKGPFQAYGPNDANLFLDYRPTEYQPQKSHIIGMIGAGLGYKENSEELKNLYKNLKIIVKPLQEFPEIYHDYQSVFAQGTDFSTQKTYRTVDLKTGTIKYVSALEYFKAKKRPEDEDSLPTAGGKKDANKGPGAKRIIKDYLVNCEFEIQVIGNEDDLQKVRHGLRHPYYPLYLGRKNCIASQIKVGDIQEIS